MIVEWISLGALIALAVWILLQRGSSNGDDIASDDALPPAALEHRTEEVQDALGTLHYGTQPQVGAAQRRLLSRGPNVATELFRVIERVDLRPQALTPSAQMRLEDVIVDFRLAGVMALRGRFSQLRCDDSAYAAALRIVLRNGPMVIEQLVADERCRALFLDTVTMRIPGDVDAYLAHYGDRLPPALRDTVQQARVRADEWLQPVARARPGTAPVGSAPTNAAERERLVRAMHRIGSDWASEVMQVATFAPADAYRSIARVIREQGDTRPPIALHALFVQASVNAEIRRSVGELLRRPDERARAAALAWCEGWSADDVVRMAAETAERTPDAITIAWAARAVARAGVGAEEALRRCLEGADATVAAGACRIAGRLPSEGLPSAVLRFAATHPDRLRLAAVTLELQGRHALVPLLKRCTEDASAPEALRASLDRVRLQAERTQSSHP